MLDSKLFTANLFFMKPKLLLSLLLILSVSVKAQIISSFTHDADSVFRNLNKSYITTGILYDRVYPYAMLHMFNTSYFDTTNVHHFIQSYYELYNAKYNNAGLLNPDTLEKRIEAITAKKHVPLGIINFLFNRIDTDAVAKNLLEDRNGIYYDVANRTQNPYLKKQVSIISPLVDSAEGLLIIFETTPALFLQNTGHTITSLKANFRDGNGLVNIGLNNSTTVSYSSYGKKIIKFVITYNDKTQVVTYAYLKLIKPKTTTAALSTTCDKDDYITASIPFTDYDNVTFRGQGNIHYYFSTATPCNGKVKKPIIFLDGFDPGDKTSITDLYNNYLNRNHLADGLRSVGFDIVILNFPVYINELGKITDGGANYIERNAFVLVKLINKLNKELQDNGSNEKIVIVGPSMGGLISRYALAYMEKHNMPHNTRLWISLDAPHNGANIPIGTQKYLQFFANNGLKEAQQALQLELNSAAAKELLLHHYLSNSDSAMGAPGFRNRFMRALKNNGVTGSDGFPVNLRKIALVDGSLSGSLQANSSACQLFLNSKSYFVVDLFLFKVRLIKVAEANISFAGSYGNSCVVLSAEELFKGSVLANGYAPATSVSYDIAPGGYTNSTAGIANQNIDNSGLFSIYTTFNIYNDVHSFVPTKSALAFKGSNKDLAESVYDRNLVCTGETPFDSYFGETQNSEHVFIDSAMARFAIDEMVGIPRNPSYVTSLASLYISGPEKFCEPGAVYSLKGGAVSEGTTFAWSVSPAIANVIYGKYPQQIQLTRISNGTATLSLALNRDCGLHQTLTKTFSIGGFSSADYPVSGPSSSCTNQTVYFSTNQLPGATNYTWFWPSGWAYVSGQGTYSITLRTGTTSGSVGVRVSNVCDAGGSPATKYVQVYNCGFIVKASPNPGSREVTITTEQNESLKFSAAKDKIFKLEVIDLYGRIRKKLNFASGVSTIKIDVSDLISGTYIIHAFNGKGWGYRQIIVAH